MIKEISNKKQQLIDDYKKTEIKVGEIVGIRTKHVSEMFGNDKIEAYEVVKVNKKTIVVKSNYVNSKETHKVDKSLVETRPNIYYVGADPFDSRFQSIRTVNYSLDSIIFALELAEKRRDEDYTFNGVKAQEVNWNPFVYDKDGNKNYYQRGFVWSTEQKQLLIESIYKGINCGVVLIRKRAWSQLEKMAKNGEKELSFNDIVDGKQRMDAIRGFINGEFPDLHGNYYSDLSNHAQHAFGNNQLFQFAEMNENTTDEETIYQFLKLNHEGVPQSKEHLNFVTKILDKIK
jgi:hypothetical protein